MKFNAAALLPLAAKLGQLVQQGMDHYVMLRSVGGTVDADVVAAFLHTQIEEWNPPVMGRRVLDAGTKQALTRFLGGIAVNLAADQREEAA
jgi:hypothetical protein